MAAEDAAGAEVGATGGLTFDNADLATFDGVPRPDGKVTVNIKGVTKLFHQHAAGIGRVQHPEPEGVDKNGGFAIRAVLGKGGHGGELASAVHGHHIHCK